MLLNTVNFHPGKQHGLQSYITLFLKYSWITSISDLEDYAALFYFSTIKISLFSLSYFTLE